MFAGHGGLSIIRASEGGDGISRTSWLRKLTFQVRFGNILPCWIRKTNNTAWLVPNINLWLLHFSACTCTFIHLHVCTHIYINIHLKWPKFSETFLYMIWHSILTALLINKLICCFCICVIYTYVCVLLAVLVHSVARRGHSTPWNWSYR